jgi:hypothetical protein
MAIFGPDGRYRPCQQVGLTLAIFSQCNAMLLNKTWLAVSFHIVTIDPCSEAGDVLNATLGVGLKTQSANVKVPE